jgi:hypothetical protein
MFGHGRRSFGRPRRGWDISVKICLKEPKRGMCTRLSLGGFDGDGEDNSVSRQVNAHRLLRNTLYRSS